MSLVTEYNDLLLVAYTLLRSQLLLEPEYWTNCSIVVICYSYFSLPKYTN